MFDVGEFNCQWYSVRRGGASYDFASHGLMERTLLRGRWESVKSARVYVNEALACSVAASLSLKARMSLRLAAKNGLSLYGL